MSTINRIQIANFLNLNGEGEQDAWEPRYRVVTFNFHGQSTAMNMTNGVGKTSNVEAWLALLTRDPQLISRTRRKMAPERDGYYSHVRIEFLVPNAGEAASTDLFAQPGSPAAGKETWVFGLYGYRSAGSVSYYYYRGSLEQVPVSGGEGGALSLLPNQQFRAALKQAERSSHHPSREDWAAELSLHVSPVSMHRQAEYQKRGGGDKSAELFALKSRKGERYDITFFYEVIAPELLSGLMDQEGEEGEHEFEDTVLNAVMDVIRSRHNTQRKKLELDKVGAVLSVLDQTSARASDAQQAQQHYQQQRARMARDVALLRNLVREQPLPGIPEPVSGEQLADRLKASVIIEPGDRDYRISAAGICLLTGEGINKLKQRADALGPEGRHIAQAIVLASPADEASASGRARKPVSYRAGIARELVQTSTQWATGLSRDTALEMLDDLEGWLLNDGAHRNPYRSRRNELGYDIEQADRDLASARQQIAASREKLAELQDQKTRMEADEAAYRDVQASGEFSEQECEDPAATAEQVEAEHREAGQQQADFLVEKGGVERQRPHWDEFIRQFPDADDPALIHQQREQQRQLASQTLEAIQQQIREAEEEGRRLQQAVSDSERLLSQSQAQMDAFARLADGVGRYEDEFGEQSPEGLAERVVNDKLQAQNQRDAASKAIDQFQVMLDRLQRFRSETGASSAAAWLAEMAEQRGQLQARKPALQQQRDNLQRQRQELDRQQVAAGPTARQALDTLASAGISVQPLHQAIDALVLSDQRRRELLSCFSALLFAPVAADAEQARAAAECLAEQDAQVPVFMPDPLAELAELTGSCQLNGDQTSGESGSGFYHGLIAGVTTRAVECLLDPSLVEREKQRLEQQISDLARQQGEIERQLKASAEDAPLMRLARQAQAAEEQQPEAGMEQQRALLLELDARLPTLRRRASDEMLQAIRAASEFARLGGAAQRDQLVTGLAQQQAELDQLRQRDQRSQALRSTLGQQQGEAQQQLKDAYPATLQTLLQRAADFAEQGGVEFLRHADQREATLQQALQRANQRKEYRQQLLRAAAWLAASRRQQQGEDVNGLIANQQAAIKQLEADIAHLGAQREQLRARRKPLDDALKAVDQAAYAAQQHYLPAMAVADELADNGSAALQDSPIYQQAETLRLAVQQDAEPAQVMMAAEALRDRLDELQIDKDLEALQQARQGAAGKLGQFIDALHQAADDDGLSEVERQRLQAIKDLSGVARLQSMTQDIRAIFEREQALYQQASAAETESRALVTDRIGYFIESAQDNLDLFRRVARAKHGQEQAHFQVSADMIKREESEALIENIITALDDEEAARGKRAQRGMESTESEEQYRGRLRDMIRQNTYRRIFKTPSVKYVSPQIRNDDRPRPLTRSLSSGQRTAMTLQWIIRLADFAISREVRGSITRVSARKRARERAQSILFVDGLFSDLSDEHLIREAMSGIRNTRGRFQLIGLIHNDKYNNDFDVFPVLLLGKLVTGRDGKGGWVSVQQLDADSSALHDTVQVAELRREVRVTQE